MTDQQPIFIQGRDIFLRPISPADHNKAYLGWLNDAEINRYTQRRFWPTSTSQGFDDDNATIHLAICMDEGSTHVGNISLGPINWKQRFAEVRILLGDRSVWRQGVGAQALYLITRHALVTLGLHRIEAGSANPAFNACVTKKLGWVEEGRKRERFFADGERLDIVMTGLLQSEFTYLSQYEKG